MTKLMAEENVAMAEFTASIREETALLIEAAEGSQKMIDTLDRHAAERAAERTPTQSTPLQGGEDL
jgi:hypothetical protein